MIFNRSTYYARARAVGCRTEGILERNVVAERVRRHRSCWQWEGAHDVQVQDVVAVHEQFALVVTLTVPDPPAAATVAAEPDSV